MYETKKVAAVGLLLLFVLPKITKGGTAVVPSIKNIPNALPSPVLTEGAANESYLGADANYYTRSILNNNLGSIILNPKARTNDPWQGSLTSSQNTDGKFEQFYTLAYGTRAMLKLLSNYINLHNRNTLTKIILHWDLGNPAYTAFLVSRTGFGANQVLQADKTTLKAIAQAIVRYETGLEFLTDARFEQGYNLL